MANTADILGEQETLDGLIAHTLENLEDNRITKIRQYAFYQNDVIESVILPNATNIGAYAFAQCYNLETVNLPNIRANYIFQNCYKLKTLNISDLQYINTYGLNSCYSLNSVNLSNIVNIQTHGLSNSGFGSIILPNCTALSQYMISNSRVSVVDISNQITIPNYAFTYAYSLVHLILRSSEKCILSNVNAFNSTPIAEGLGWIYVPSDLVELYKADTNWSTFANRIVSINEYPKTLAGETISDTWEEIFQAETNDTYKTKYSIGDTKYLIIGGTYVLMQIVAFDRDIVSSDGTSTAKITWLSKGSQFVFPMNFTNTSTGGWADCECRKFLNDTIYEQIPSVVKNNILAVNKTYNATSSPTSTATVSDKLWLPSQREVFGDSTRENSGIDYTDFFTDNSTRVKGYGLLAASDSSFWRLRSVVSSTTFATVTSIGSGGNSNSATSAILFPIGFCT